MIKWGIIQIGMGDGVKGGLWTYLDGRDWDAKGRHGSRTIIDTIKLVSLVSKSLDMAFFGAKNTFL